MVGVLSRTFPRSVHLQVSLRASLPVGIISRKYQLEGSAQATGSVHLSLLSERSTGNSSTTALHL